MPKILCFSVSISLILFCGYFFIKLITTDQVDTAMHRLEYLRDNDSLPLPIESIKKEYITMENSAGQYIVKELFRRALSEQIYRAALAYDNRKALLRGADNDHNDLELRRRLWKKIEETDADNVRWLQITLSHIGWFRISTYGPTASHIAWLLVQHADRNPEFQESTLKELKKLLPQGEVSARDVAYLEDRIVVKSARPQIYGTQGKCEGGGWEPFVIADPKHLDDRRRLIGLEPMIAYKRKFTSMCKVN